jgi:hypothetical protein
MPLHDVVAKAQDWCQRVQPLCADQCRDGAETLIARLDSIGAGFRLRRQLDGEIDDQQAEAARRAVVPVLTDLQARAAEQIGPSVLSKLRKDVSARLRGWLGETRATIRGITTDVGKGPLPQAMAIESLHGDLEWLSGILARLDGEAPHPFTAWLDVELDRVRGRLRSPADRRADPRDEPLRLSCQRLQAVVLESRIRRELARPSAGRSCEELWLERFQLSRLEAQLAALAEGGETGLSAGLAGDELSAWIRELESRRAELADAADAQLFVIPVPRRRGPCERMAQTACDEAGETIAFLEDLSKSRAVKRLDLLRDDVRRLVASCRRWAVRAPAAASAAGGDGAAASAAVRQGAAGDVASRHAAGSGEFASLGAVQIDRQQGPGEPENSGRAAAVALRRQAQRVARLSRQVRAEWQEKLLALRMEALLGRRGAALLENTVLVLILALVALIATEAVLEYTRPGGLSESQHLFFAWADLAVCSVFLFEFALKMILAPRRLSYFVRHLAIDFLASLPFGFVAHSLALAQLETAVTAGAAPSFFQRLVQLGSMARVLRFVRVILPAARLARVGLVLLRLSDRMMRRMAGLFNRNIILFEPLRTYKPESSDRHRLRAMRGEIAHLRSVIEARLDREQRRQLAARVLFDLECRVKCLPAPAAQSTAHEVAAREIPIEAVVERLIQMTPERLVDRMGPAFVIAVDRYLRLLDLPFVRRVPGVTNLLAYRQKSRAEAVALLANYLGHLIQRGLDVIYFCADLQGTLSPPVFLDRLGATIESATRTPARRLLWLGSVFLVLFLVVESVSFLKPFRGVVAKIQALLGWPVIILGVICLVFWLLGAWFRRIANQSADFCERVVEAQFVAHTKGLKSRRSKQDAQFLAERVIDPELLLRSSDDRVAEPVCLAKDEEHAERGRFLFENRELAFLHNVRLLYQDYLDGSPLHRSDTKASVQLLGNLALSNLRRSHLGHLLRESRALDRLDLSRSGGLFGGPYLWFNYITRMLVQETALLILDYNRHAVPLDRLACSPPEIRRRFQEWVAARLKIDPDEVWLPEPADSRSDQAETAVPATGSRIDGSLRGATAEEERRVGADEFLETVEFTAVDFLGDDPERETVIRARFGPQVAELVRRDRQQNVRRAFRSFPLHELPLTARTLNPFSLYEAYLAGGRVLLLPFVVARVLVRGLWIGVGSIYQVVHAILHPQLDRERLVPPDTYWAALRKIHRMRKPVFMGSLWLRARFDVEYLGLALPSAPPGIATQSLMETDLDYIGATRQDRIIAEQLRRQHQMRLEWVARWLVQFGWTFEELPGYLSREIPFLANRGGEALRALVASCVLDHDDIATLARSIEGLKRTLAHAADPALDPRKLPPGLPDPVVNLRALWHPAHRCKRPLADLFELPCFPAYDLAQRRRIVRYLRAHRRAVRGWIKVVLGQGGPDPWATVKSRMRAVLLRTDLWSDQILVLRAVQTLTMLDLQHNCELVWSLGGYTRTEAERPEETVGTEDESVNPRAGAPPAPLDKARSII